MRTGQHARAWRWVPSHRDAGSDSGNGERGYNHCVRGGRRRSAAAVAHHDGRWRLVDQHFKRSLAPPCGGTTLQKPPHTQGRRQATMTATNDRDCHVMLPPGGKTSLLHATDWSAACRLLAAWVAHGGMLHMTEPVLCVPRPQFKLLSPACCLCWCGSAQIVCASPRPTFSGGCPATTTGGDVAPALLRCCHVTWPPHTAW